MTGSIRLSRDNSLLDTDPQLQEAALRRVLRSCRLKR